MQTSIACTDNPSAHKSTSDALKMVRFLIPHINEFQFAVWIWI